MIKKIKEYHLLTPRKIIIFVMLGIILTHFLKDYLTPIIFNGKSFFGRSFQSKILLFWVYSISFSTIIFSFISLLTHLWGKNKNFLIRKLPQKFLEILKSILFRLKAWKEGSKTYQLIFNSRVSWLSISITVLLSTLFYLLLEWIFLLSKPSFMTILPFSEKILILSFAFSFLSGLAILGIGFVFFITRIFTKRAVPAYFLVFPAAIFSLATLLIIDNFTYTIFSIGIISTTGLFRIFYILLLFFFIFLILKDLVKINKHIDKVAKEISIKRKYFAIIPLVLLITIPLFNNRMYAQSYIKNEDYISNQDINSQPHIVLLTVEGLNATHMSLYGYERDTTPFIEEKFSNSAMIAQNSFTNSAHTAGSITSILTSKYPTNTRVLYPPDILRSEDSYEHLPGILKSKGYKTFQFSIDHYADAYQLNMLNAFDKVNGRENQRNIFLSSINRFLSGNISYFFYELNVRIVDRISHLLFLRNSDNTFKQITESTIHYDDFEKFEEAINLLENATSPHFIHIHWMNTHGSKFFPKEQVFSNGEDPSQQGDWNIDFYDDSILEFDSALSVFWDKLVEIDQIKNTVLIITSDHGEKYITTVRIPLVIYFPEEDLSKLIESNVQNMDIAPTILDYLNLQIPNWMQGKSLLNKENQHYPIISVKTSSSKLSTEIGPEFEVSNAYIQPPFYQFSSIFVIDCNKWYQFNLDNLAWSNGYIADYANACEEENLLNNNQISEIVFDRLSSDGFELPNKVVESIYSLE